MTTNPPPRRCDCGHAQSIHQGAGNECSRCDCPLYIPSDDAISERDRSALDRAEEAIVAIVETRVATDHGQLVEYIDVAETAMREYLDQLARIVRAAKVNQ